MNKKEIEQALRDYNWMLNEIKRQREILNHIGGNITANIDDMPKGEGQTSDPVAMEVIRRDKTSRWLQKLENKVLEIQKRMKVIENERERAVLECMLDGMSMRAISNHMGLSERHVFRIKDSIVKQMADMSDLAGSCTKQKSCV